MKNVIFGICTFLFSVLVIAGVTCIHARNARQTEVEDALASAVEQSIDNAVSEKEYTIEDTEAFTADILQSILYQLDSDSDVTVEIKGADIENGILSVCVTQEFDYVLGKKGTISVERTAVFNTTADSEEEEEGETYHTISFYIKEEKDAEDLLYKSYTITKDDTVPAPAEPVIENATFLYWTDEAGNKVEVSELCADSDKNLYAKMKYQEKE